MKMHKKEIALLVKEEVVVVCCAVEITNRYMKLVNKCIRETGKVEDLLRFLRFKNFYWHYNCYGYSCRFPPAIIKEET